MKGEDSVFWDIKPCSPLRVNLPPVYTLFLVPLIFRPWRWRRHVPPKRRLSFNGLYGFISQKVELLVTIGVRNSNPKRMKVVWNLLRQLAGRNTAAISKCNILSRFYGVWLWTGFELVIGFTAHLYTQFITTSNYSDIANSHTAIYYSTHLSLLSLLCFQ
jgi:hypothetical protein